MYKLFFAGLVVASGFAHSGEIHKCTVNGSVVYQGKPCKGSGKTVGQVMREESKKNDLTYKPWKPSQEQTNTPTSSKLKSQSTVMRFDECKKKVLGVQLSVAGTKYKSAVIANTKDMYIAKVCTSDGSVILTCSRLDNNLVTTKSSQCF